VPAFSKTEFFLGRQVSLLVALLLRGLTLAAAPAGVECPPLQSTGAKNQHCTLTQPFVEAIIWRIEKIEPIFQFARLLMF
jgi:hypothetical protein